MGGSATPPRPLIPYILTLFLLPLYSHKMAPSCPQGRERRGGRCHSPKPLTPYILTLLLLPLYPHKVAPSCPQGRERGGGRCHSPKPLTPYILILLLLPLHPHKAMSSHTHKPQRPHLYLIFFLLFFKGRYTYLEYHALSYWDSIFK